MAIDANGNVIPDQQQMAPGIQIVQPPAEVDRSETVGPSNSTETVTMSPQTQVAAQDVHNAGQDKLAAAARGFEAKTPQMQAEATAADANLANDRLTEIRVENARAEQAKQVAAEVAEAKRLRQQTEAAAHPTAFWQDRSAPARVVSAFLVGLGGYGASVNGGPNQAYEILKDEQARDANAKMKKFETSKYFMETQKEDAEKAAKLRLDEIQRIREEGISQRGLIEKQLGSITKRLAIPSAKAAFDELQAKTKQEDAAAEVKTYEHYDQKHTEQSGHTVTSHTVNNNPAAQSNAQDLTVLDATGKPIGLARSPKEALELREKRTALETGNAVAEKLKGEITSNGKLVPLIQADKQAIRSTYISQMLGAKKAITGAVNEQDEKRAGNKFDTAWNRGPDAVVKSIDAWKAELSTDYTAAVRSSARTDGSDAVPSNTPNSTPAAPTKRPAKAEIASDADRLRAALKADPTGPRADAIRAALKRMAGEYGRN